MREYGNVHSTFWSSQTTHNLADDAKLLALYLLTGPHSTALGCYRAPDGYVMEDLGWDTKRVTKAFNELFTKGWAKRCETTKWVLISNYLKWNRPDNPNQRKNLHRLAAQVPENFAYLSDLNTLIAEHVGVIDQLDLPLENNGSKRVTQTPVKPSPNQEQEQEQLQNSQNHHAFGAMMKKWMGTKETLKALLSEKEWNLWVRPAYLIKVMPGDVALVSLPPNGKIMEAARDRKALALKVAKENGLQGVGFTRYPDAHEMERLKKLYPEQWQQFSPAVRKAVDAKK